jgi:protein TonB
MKLIITSLAFFFAASVCAQVDSTKAIPDEDGEGPKIFIVAQTPAQFVGGTEAWNKYLEKNLDAKLAATCVRIPEGKKVGRSTVIVTFIINKYGFVSEVAAENDPHPKLTAEAIRVIKEGPKWKPAEQNGRKVNYRHRQAISWQVSEE